MSVWNLVFVVLLLKQLVLFETYCHVDVKYNDALRHEEYDYIIVGSGSAGAVVASRLSEDARNKVLLLEAGGLPTDISEIPYFCAELLNTEMDWNYTLEPQVHKGMKRISYPRGKALGGSSSINFLLYVRGNHRDFDEWAKQGATGWSGKELLHYFKKSEDQRDQLFSKNGYHGRHGYLTVSSNVYVTPLRDAYLEAGKSLGYNIVDVNCARQLGFSRVQSTIRDGLRCSTEKAFLRPAVHRTNLDIVMHAHVTKIDFDDQKRAKSVRFERNGASNTASARKEIIISAGVIGSPQLLMLSGIGPKEHLEKLGITVISDLPVGQNLQDHVAASSGDYILNDTVGIVYPRDVTHRAIGALLRGQGPLTVPANIETVAFINSKYQDASENWPDLQFFFTSTMAVPKEDLQYSPYNVQDSTQMFTMLMRPKSRGFVKLRSKDPFEHPIIDPKYFSDEDDLKRLIEGMKFTEKLIQTDSLQKYGPRANRAVPENCRKMTKGSDEFLMCMAASMTATAFHQCGTCKMGDVNDPATVVDSKLRVKGVTGLRVADASIMPNVVSANTNAACIMIGEKAADMIRKSA